MKINKLRIGQVVYVNNNNDPYHGQMGMIFELRSSNVENVARNVARIAIDGGMENILVKAENLSNYDPNETKPAAEWMSELYPNFEISDPDGWDKENFLEQYHIVPLTREEFKEKINMSTLVPKSDESKKPITADVAKRMVRKHVENEVDSVMGTVYQRIRQNAKDGKSIASMLLSAQEARRLMNLGYKVKTTSGVSPEYIVNETKCVVKWT